MREGTVAESSHSKDTTVHLESEHLSQSTNFPLACICVCLSAGRQENDNVATPHVDFDGLEALGDTCAYSLVTPVHGPLLSLVGAALFSLYPFPEWM